MVRGGDRARRLLTNEVRCLGHVHRRRPLLSFVSFVFVTHAFVDGRILTV